MNEQFSPVSQRLIAIGLLVLALLVAFSLVIMPAFALLRDGLASLRDLRLQVARAEAIRDRPEPPPMGEVPADLYITAPDRKAANDMLVGQLAALAARHGLQAQIDPAPEQEGAAPALLTVSFLASGETKPVLTFFTDLERGTPLIRFRSLQITQGNGGMPLADPAQPAAVSQQPVAGPNGVSLSGVPPVLAVPPPPHPSPSTAEGAVMGSERLALQATVIALWGAKK